MSEGNIHDLLRRLSRSRKWVAAQLVLTLLLLLFFVAWTRLPDKHVWQVMLDLVVPLLLVVSLLELEAGTVRAFADDDGTRVKLVWGAVTLLVWIAVGAAAWALLDWFDDQIPLWAGYLTSKSGARARATLFTYEHVQRWLTALEWIARWIVVPAKLIPYAAATAQWGWRLPWRRVFRFLWNWRWWIGVVIASIAGVWLPSQFFKGPPKGTVNAQIWILAAKLVGAYILAVVSWVLLLGWWATLFSSRQKPPDEEAFVAVAAPSGPPDRELKAKADIPPRDDDIPA
ncbi:MAG: hypothetical protein ACLPY1_05040 [Terracidiphilus sp.]